jgi:toxin FitB
MRLLDSNILIYSSKPEFSYLRALLKDPECVVSAISKLEVLGYHQLLFKDKIYFEAIFKAMKVISISDDIIEEVISLRQKQKMSNGDSIIAATALVLKLEIESRNTTDFSKIKGIKVNNPIL